VYEIDNPSGRHMTHTHPERPETASFIMIMRHHAVSKAWWSASSMRSHKMSTVGAGLPFMRLRAIPRSQCSSCGTAKANVKDSQHQTPLHTASHQGYTEVIQSLITPPCRSESGGQKMRSHCLWHQDMEDWRPYNCLYSMVPRLGGLPFM